MTRAAVQAAHLDYSRRICQESLNFPRPATILINWIFPKLTDKILN